jgi:hypothetical protein
MARRPRSLYTNEIKVEIWNKYQKGESLWSIARSIDRSSSTIYGILSPSGGIRPPERRRSSLSLSLATIPGTRYLIAASRWAELGIVSPEL